LKDLLTAAWEIKSYQVLGPDWIESERYDIVARIPPGTSREQFSIMLQNLLTERFKLTILQEKRDLPVFELMVAKNGPKLKPWVQDPSTLNASAVPEAGPPPNGEDGIPIPRLGQIAVIGGNGRVRIAARKAAVGKLADRLSAHLGRPVLDKTGLTGEYDYTLEFSPATETAPDQDVRSLFTAVQDQLGLKLEPKKNSIDVVVIEKAEKIPTEN